MTEPTVSVIIPLYNGERFIADAIRSVQSQSVEGLECIVVDDGSTDHSAAIAAGFGDSVRVIRKSNGGVADARNVGIEAAEARFIALLDADDVWRPSKLTCQLPLFETEEGIGLVYCGLQIVDEELNPIEEHAAPPPEIGLRNSLLMEEPYISIPSTGVFPKEVLTAVGGFDERLSTSADTDLVCRVALRYPIRSVPEPLVLYRVHSGQMHLGVDAMQRDMLLVFDKLFGDPSLPEGIRSLRRRAHANLYASIAGHYLKERKIGKALPYLVRAAGSDPLRTFSLAVQKLDGAKGRG